jgi:hypothetical protein
MFEISRKMFLLLIMTLILTLFGIITLASFLAYGNQLHLQSTLGDGDDSRKNIAINSTIGPLCLRSINVSN